ncbi:MAG: hypothetical protein IKX20_07755 [Paludibacteraceae bacterium]|nr:hypothetical protein [Paludibacteraceae bacterium]
MKGLRTKEIAAKFGLTDELVRNLCHARGQRFATRLVPGGRWYIDDELFQEFWDRKQERTRETRGTLR